MADPEHDPDVSKRYRELARDEPPPELDAKIRAAALRAASEDSRRAGIVHPAPLVAPTGRRSWYFPVAAAAVIVLAVAVTWQMEREEVDTFAVSPQAASESKEARSKEEPQKSQGAKEQEKIAPLAKRAEKPAPATPEPPAATQAPAESASGTRSVPRDREQAYESRGDRARQERPSAAVPAPAPQREMQRDSVASAVQGAVQGKPAEESPQQWLERIAQLRQQGRHEEADKALAELRKRYPDYKIPDAVLERVEKK